MLTCHFFANFQIYNPKMKNGQGFHVQNGKIDNSFENEKLY